MAQIDSQVFDIGYMDRLSRLDTPVHRLDPRAKLLTTLVFVVTVVSFGKYEISALLPFFLYPVVLAAVGEIPLGYLLKKIAVVSPFAIMLGIFNPFFDREIIAVVGSLELSGGWVSFCTILLRFLLTVSAALVLVAVSGFNEVCRALEQLGAPRVFVVQLMFLYRYLFVLTDEAVRMFRARALRTFGTRGSSMKVWGSMLGQLLLRTLDRAQRIHLAMLCRGFTGEIRTGKTSRFGRKEVAFLLGWSAFFLLARLYNLPQTIGITITELFS
jgi:cobalt/nickel transport system permease protein